MTFLAALILTVAPAACRGATDGILCMPLPRVWSRVVSPRHVGGQSAAYLLAGNFRFHVRPNTEAWPTVPAHKVAIDIADFPVLGRSAHWPRLGKLGLPKQVGVKRSVRWNVRFSGRAVTIEVRFGSTPTSRTQALVNRRLAAVARID
jgi:hypothetical protein